MLQNKLFLKLFVLFLNCSLICGQWEVPEPKVEVLERAGFRVSIPDEEGIKLMAFHGKINEEIVGREGGVFSKDVLKPKDGRWTFFEPVAKLKVGDSLNFWLYVIYNNGKNELGYESFGNEVVITPELIVRKSKPSTSTPPITVVPTDTRGPSGGCDAQLTIVNGFKMCKKGEIFSDYFNKFNRSRWNVEKKFADAPDYPFVMYNDIEETINNRKGHLTIKPILSEHYYPDFGSTRKTFDFGKDCTGEAGTQQCVQKAAAFLILPPVISAQITSKGKFSFKYGKIEVKAKLPKGDWIYPELYLTPQNHEYGPGIESGQIRIAFSSGNKASTKDLSGGCVLGADQASKNYATRVFKIAQPDRSWSNEYHIFTVDWRADRIILSVDNNVYGDITPPEGGFASCEKSLGLKYANKWSNGEAMAPFDKEMYITFGVGVGGNVFADQDDGNKPWVNNKPRSQKDFYEAKSKWYSTWGEESQLDIEYVKVYSI